jgi:hypothetical protein
VVPCVLVRNEGGCVLSPELMCVPPVGIFPEHITTAHASLCNSTWCDVGVGVAVGWSWSAEAGWLLQGCQEGHTRGRACVGERERVAFRACVCEWGWGWRV